jgi:hypothetical protein
MRRVFKTYKKAISHIEHAQKMKSIHQRKCFFFQTTDKKAPETLHKQNYNSIVIAISDKIKLISLCIEPFSVTVQSLLFSAFRR